ncbi:MAG: hypothetical protein ACM3NI_11895 [Bacteroidota bacterium]
MKKIFIGISLLLSLAAGGAHAQDPLLDDVETSVEPDWAKIRISFVLPVNYVRHFPKEHGQLLQIFFTVTGLDTHDISLLEDVRHVSATPVLPATTITYDPPASLNLQRDPSSLSVRFDRAVDYQVRPGDDHRSIVIYLPVVPAQSAPADTTKDKPAK